MFVTFIENNSEDYYIQNKDIDGVVIIEGEGESLEEILNKANYIFKNYREYYRCCEERWDDDLKDEEDIEDTIINRVISICFEKEDLTCILELQMRSLFF